MTTIKTLKLSLIALCFTFISSTGYSQFTFSISKGNILSDASLGYKTKKFVPYASIKYWGGSVDYNNKYANLDFFTGEITYDENSGSTSINVFVPTLGLKYFLHSKNDIKAFVNASVSKPIITGKATYTDEFETDSEELDGISAISGDLGFGVEYFFSENFSIGGEYGFRYMNLSSESSNSYQSTDNTGMEHTLTSTYKDDISFSPTYTKASLNFYF